MRVFVWGWNSVAWMRQMIMKMDLLLNISNI